MRKTSKPVIPSMKYFSINRAAEILNVSPEDILYLHTTEKISIKIFLDGLNERKYELDFLNVHGNIKCLTLDNGAMRQEELSRHAITHHGMAVKTIIIEGYFSGYEPLHMKPHVNIISAALTEKPLVSFLGLFDLNIPQSQAIKILNNEAPGMLSVGVITDESSLNIDFDFDMAVLPRLFVMHNEMLVIHDMLNSKINNTEQENEHHVTNFSLSTRQSVLCAAIHAREKWPDDCKNGAKWAATIFRESQNLFNRKEPPLSEDVMKRMLSAAMSSGNVFTR